MDKKPLLPKISFNGKLITHLDAQTISLSMHGLTRSDIADILGNDSVSTINQRYTRLYNMYDIHDFTLFMLMARDHGFDRKGYCDELYLFEDWPNPEKLPLAIMEAIRTKAA